MDESRKKIEGEGVEWDADQEFWAQIAKTSEIEVWATARLSDSLKGLGLSDTAVLLSEGEPEHVRDLGLNSFCIFGSTKNSRIWQATSTGNPLNLKKEKILDLRKNQLHSD